MWTHYTSVPLDKVLYADQEDAMLSPLMKPIGIWLGLEDEWKSWCLENENSAFDMNDYYKYRVDFDADSRIKTVTNFEELTSFIDDYNYGYGYAIDWVACSLSFDGIVFLGVTNMKKKFYAQGALDYQKYMLLFSLHISSVCIWNPRAIKKIVLAERHKTS